MANHFPYWDLISFSVKFWSPRFLLALKLYDCESRQQSEICCGNGRHSRLAVTQFRLNNFCSAVSCLHLLFTGCGQEVSPDSAQACSESQGSGPRIVLDNVGWSSSEMGKVARLSPGENPICFPIARRKNQLRTATSKLPRTLNLRATYVQRALQRKPNVPEAFCCLLPVVLQPCLLSVCSKRIHTQCVRGGFLQPE